MPRTEPIIRALDPGVATIVDALPLVFPSPIAALVYPALMLGRDPSGDWSVLEQNATAEEFGLHAGVELRAPPRAWLPGEPDLDALLGQPPGRQGPDNDPPAMPRHGHVVEGQVGSRPCRVHLSAWPHPAGLARILVQFQDLGARQFAEAVTRDVINIVNGSGRVLGRTADQIHATVQGVEQGLRTTEASETDNGRHVTSLQHSVKEISAIAQEIRSIASQTNLLALNAAIEAARAGDVGRGFAVVAGEVKNLSQRVQGATLRISDIVDAVQGVSGDIRSACEASMQSVEHSRRLLEGSGADVTQMRRVSHVSSLRAAKGGHRLFVFRVQGDLERERPKVDPASLASHRACGLGEWYEANRGTPLGELPSFRALEGPHTRLHEQVRGFAELLHAGRRTDALALVAVIEQELDATLAAIDAVVADLERQLG